MPDDTSLPAKQPRLITGTSVGHISKEPTKQRLRALMPKQTRAKDSAIKKFAAYLSFNQLRKNKRRASPPPSLSHSPGPYTSPYISPPPSPEPSASARMHSPTASATSFSAPDTSSRSQFLAQPRYPLNATNATARHPSDSPSQFGDVAEAVVCTSPGDNVDEDGTDVDEEEGETSYSCGSVRHRPQLVATQFMAVEVVEHGQDSSSPKSQKLRAPPAQSMATYDFEDTDTINASQIPERPVRMIPRPGPGQHLFFGAQSVTIQPAALTFVTRGESTERVQTVGAYARDMVVHGFSGTFENEDDAEGMAGVILRSRRDPTVEQSLQLKRLELEKLKMELELERLRQQC